MALTRLETGTDDRSPGAPHDEMLHLVGLGEDGRVALEVFFDIEDIGAATAELDAAYARFELERHRAPLENAASQADKRFNTLFAERRWEELGALLTDDIRVEDRRRGLRREGSDRDTELAELRAIADLGTRNMTSAVLAIRGERLALVRTLYSGRDQRPEAFHTEVIRIAEIDAEERIVAYVAFDPDDFEAAIAELDARYLAGEAATHARVWSLVSAAYAGYNRRELPPTTPDWVIVDHRRVTTYASGDVFKYVRVGLNTIPDITFHVEAVHHLSNLGAVVTQAGHGTSKEGFDAEWREIHLMTVDGELFNRSEIFDEADVDAALARFEQLSGPARRLENAASRVNERFLACFADRDWDAMADALADDHFSEDRRRVVNADLHRGRDAELENFRSAAEVGCTHATSNALAARGERLALARARYEGPEGFHVDLLQIVEIDTDERIAAFITFDPDDFESAIAELDGRYLGGEASAHAHTWSLITAAFTAINRHELPKLMPDWVNIDHRRGASFATGAMTAYLHDLWNDAPDINVYSEVVHRLSNVGAVITQAAHGTSQQGFQAEWREIGIFTFDGNLLSHYELFDEADLATALAKFEQLSRPAPQLENAASQAVQRYAAAFAARDWDALAKVLADDISVDDRRRVVNAGIRRGRGAEIANLQATADAGFAHLMFIAIATRGDRLILAGSSGRGAESGEFQSNALGIAEINSDNQIAAIVVFDSDDFEAAITELDARYLAGEAADHAETWSAVLQPYTAINRRELFATTPDWVNIDHRQAAAFAPGEADAYVRESLDDGTGSIYVETVHQLGAVGAVVTWTATGTTQEGFDAEWRGIHVLTVDGDLLSRFEVFDEADLDTALTKFGQLSRPVSQLTNAASGVAERSLAQFAARNWDAMADMLADNFSQDDRRRVVGAGFRHGRDAQIADMRAIAEVWITNGGSTVIATRGERLALIRTGYSDPGQGPEAFLTETLCIVEINADERAVAAISFDLDDFEAAITELDARFLAGEASDHAQIWSVITRDHAVLSRRELPPTTTDLVSIDHRRGTSFAPGGLIAYFSAGFDLDQDIRTYVEVVHRLSDLGAVCTHVGQGISREGFDAEWRGIDVLTVVGDSVNRCEVFEEADLNAALAKFDQLSRPTPRLENAATRIWERLRSFFDARDWNAMAEMYAEDHVHDDRRRITGGGIRRGRNASVENMRVVADLVEKMAVEVIAIRGERLVLARVRYWGPDKQPQAFPLEMFCLVETNLDDRMSAFVAFDPDDIDAAFEELDARFLAGDGALHAATWSFVTRTNTAINRHEMPPSTPDSVMIDHRLRATLGTDDLTAYIRAAWDLTPDLRVFIESVHQLSDLGAVVTHVSRGASPEGFDAEWRQITLMTAEGELGSRCEMFDEADLDTALARFEELLPRTPRLENTASQIADRVMVHFSAREWDAAAELVADDFSSDDRRRTVNAGIQQGRDAAMKDAHANADVGAKEIRSTVIATRGERLVLRRARYASSAQRPEAFYVEALIVYEINTDGQLAASVVFDVEDIDAAFAELENRYLAGEAVAHAHAWSVITRAYAAMNRHELPATAPDWVNIDHRRGIAFAPGDATTYLRATQDPRGSVYIETVLRLSDLGAVFTWAGHGTSQQGFEAEWRGINVLTIEGELISRGEIFDEADLDTALARFEELQQQVPRLENAASQALARFWACFGIQDWAAMVETMADDFASHDHRRVVNAGVLHGRDANIANMRAVAEVGFEGLASTAIATRGQRLALTRTRSSAHHFEPGEVSAVMLGIVEIGNDNRLTGSAWFDLGDIDAAFAELDARYLAGEAAAHAHTWSVIAETYAAFNRHELPAKDWRIIDHRPLVGVPVVSAAAIIRSVWDLAPDLSIQIEAVHRLSGFGAVIALKAYGTSPEGFAAEWRMIQLPIVEGDRVDACEVFDEADLDAALARFEELQPRAPRLENAATQVCERFQAHLAANDWARVSAIAAEDIVTDDRRPVIGAGVQRGRDANIASLRASFEIGLENVTSTAIATRGERLLLDRVLYSGRGEAREPFHSEILRVLEVDAERRITAGVYFDVNDIDAAFEELDTRYLAGEAAAHGHTWSVIARTYAAFNRRELSATTADWVYTDHRALVSTDASDLPAYIHTGWDLMPYVSIYMETVHRLTDLGVVVTHTARGVSHEDSDVEWRMVNIFTVDGDLISRCEMFDEADLDAALARFDELSTDAGQALEGAS